MNGIAWALDYAYVAFWQVYGFFLRADPSIYTSAGPSIQKREPIILIPGIYENWQFMKPIADMLYRKGHTIHTISGLGYNVGTIEAMAEIVHDYIVSHNLQGCVIVAHSKGGLAGKYLLARYNSGRAVKSMIALHTPFSGSKYAYYIPLRSVRVFLPGSYDLSALEANIQVNESIVSIYGVFDPHIPEGSYLRGARNISLNTRGHFRILRNPLVHQAIIENM